MHVHTRQKSNHSTFISNQWWFRENIISLVFSRMICFSIANCNQSWFTQWVFLVWVITPAHYPAHSLTHQPVHFQRLDLESEDKDRQHEAGGNSQRSIPTWRPRSTSAERGTISGWGWLHADVSGSYPALLVEGRNGSGLMMSQLCLIVKKRLEYFSASGSTWKIWIGGVLGRELSSVMTMEHWNSDAAA